MSCLKCNTATLPCVDCQTPVNCQKCNTPNAGICFWWCEEMKDKIHPKLLEAFKKNAEELARSKKFWNRNLAKVKKFLRIK